MILLRSNYPLERSPRIEIKGVTGPIVISYLLKSGKGESSLWLERLTALSW